MSRGASGKQPAAL
uniref:Uncharacterized protein n=1 Tax=Arundo donax TaxID=35708 RepID=A0A0A9CEC3_ARUDO